MGVGGERGGTSSPQKELVIHSYPELIHKNEWMTGPEREHREK
jgi:hypothetical protein